MTEVVIFFKFWKCFDLATIPLVFRLSSYFYKLKCSILTLLAFLADICRASFAAEGSRQGMLGRQWKPALRATTTLQLMRRTMAQHGRTHMKHQHRMHDNQLNWCSNGSGDLFKTLSLKNTLLLILFMLSELCTSRFVYSVLEVNCRVPEW